MEVSLNEMNLQAKADLGVFAAELSVEFMYRLYNPDSGTARVRFKLHRRIAGVDKAFAEVVWDVVAERLEDALSEISLGALCKQAVRAKLRGAHPDAPMYFI